MEGQCSRCGQVGPVIRGVRPSQPDDVRLFCLRCALTMPKQPESAPRRN